ncbi:hypothetical protein FA398_28240 [Pseudomonas aeruginosa]|uniref:hypothetical protein n=1 Tax=Pseudomonas aeruginosa TaxID=287 RepID=UPI000F527D30|nr:hypothetical protein [Pseudomonas aeruginosa]MCO2122858.1 hypothetical protein [Pseudomonas aeruginosa]
MRKIIIELIDLLRDQRLLASDVVPWAAPIPSFGDPSLAAVATLGLNPSNKEFVDNQNQEIQGGERRFHTLNSLGLEKWEQISEGHIKLIEESCREYFSRNPYNTWFKSLDLLISGTSKSYYNKLFHAVHLDLIPFATHTKWAALTSAQKRALLDASSNTLEQIMKGTPIRVLVLNGKTVVERFEGMIGRKLNMQNIPDWDLKRNNIASVKGFSYQGVINRISDVSLDNPILVLGFNHNIQSSYGVTSKVRASIRDWIAKQTAEVL